jgi:hypothetical protein
VGLGVRIAREQPSCAAHNSVEVCCRSVDHASDACPSPLPALTVQEDHRTVRDRAAEQHILAESFVPLQLRLLDKDALCLSQPETFTRYMPEIESRAD